MSRLTALIIGLLTAAILAFFCIRSHMEEIPHDIETRLTALLSENKIQTVSSFDTKANIDTDLSDVRSARDLETSPVLTVINGRDVTLRGIVKDEAEKLRIFTIAQNVEGVRIVHNELQTLEEGKQAELTDSGKSEAAELKTGIVPAPVSETVTETAAEKQAITAPVPAESAPDFEPEPVTENTLSLTSANNPYFTATDEEAKKCAVSIANIAGERTVYFNSSSAILNRDGRIFVHTVASALKTCSDMNVKVIGHTDSSGSEPLNKRLSVLRARAVADRLRKFGIPANRLRSEGVGSDRPVAENSDYAGRTKNRRIEFQLTTAVKAN